MYESKTETGGGIDWSERKTPKIKRSRGNVCKIRIESSAFNWQNRTMP